MDKLRTSGTTGEKVVDYVIGKVRKVVDVKKKVVDLFVDNVIERMRRQVTGIGR